MGKPITHEYSQGKTILKHFPYLGAACIVLQTMAPSEDENGYKIVKAGTPFPSNDENCKGYLLHDVDVTQGDAPGTYIYQGDIDNTKLTENSITVVEDAKKATPRVTFWD